MSASDLSPSREPRAGALWSAAWSAIPVDVVRRLERGGAALEVGCGTGLACIALAEEFPAARITGHDPDANAISQAVALARAAGLEQRLCFTVADSTRLPRCTCDLVAMWGLFRRPPDPRRLLNAIRNALVPDGTCLVLETSPAPRDPGAEEALRSLARAAGFTRFTTHADHGRLRLFDLRR